MRTEVVIMSKIPQPGFTKTRLKSILSEQECSDFHRTCLADTCRAVRQSTLPGYIYYAEGPGDHSPELKNGAENADWGLSEEERAYFKMHPQQGEDLGERLFNAAREILTRCEAVLFLGSDMPQITADTILEAQAKLFGSDIVIGPAHDGGYYLLGLKQAIPGIFQSIPWGTFRVLQITLERISASNLTLSLLKPQSDIDTWDDLKNFYCAGKAGENNLYRQLSAYKYATEMVEKYGVGEES